MNGSNALVISTKGLSKAYQGVKVLDALNLQVPKNFHRCRRVEVPEVRALVGMGVGAGVGGK
jgi:hypothetical protein